jgi:DNA-binding response OmpR family regulator
MESKTVLVADADKHILDLLDYNLEQAGFDVVTSTNGVEAMAAVASHFPSLILLDRQLPVMDGDEVCGRIKEYKGTAHIPVIMMSVSGEEDEIVSALENGADDYATMPFSVAELVARINALIRRADGMPTSGERLTFGGLVIDIDGRGAYVDGEAIKLTSKEYELLRILAEHRNTVMDRKYLMNQVWGYTYIGTGKSRTLDVHIRHLREKLGVYGEYIQTVYMVGYKFSDPGAPLQNCEND